MAIITVIIPVFNKEKYVRKILESLMCQSFRDFECIIVNDGSTDNSAYICSEMIKNDHRFVLYNTKNRGVSHARNYAIDRSSGKFITFVDADDYVKVDYLQNLYQGLLESGADMVIGGLTKVWNSSSRMEAIRTPYVGEYEWEDICSDFAKVQSETGIYGFCVAKLIRKELLGAIRFDESLVLAEDLDFYLRLYPEIRSLYFLDKVDYMYLQQAENSSALVNDYAINYVQQLWLMIKYRKFLKKMDFYRDTNKKIIDQRLSDYVYFSILYCDRNSIKQKIEQLHNIYIKECVPLNGKNIWEKILLHMVKSNSATSAFAILSIYDVLRNMKR